MSPRRRRNAGAMASPLAMDAPYWSEAASSAWASSAVSLFVKNLTAAILSSKSPRFESLSDAL